MINKLNIKKKNVKLKSKQSKKNVSNDNNNKIKKISSFLSDAFDDLIKKEWERILYFYIFLIFITIINLFYCYIVSPYIANSLNSWDLTPEQVYFIYEVMIGIPIVIAIIAYTAVVFFLFKVISYIILFKQKKTDVSKETKSFSSKDSSNK